MFPTKAHQRTSLWQLHSSELTSPIVSLYWFSNAKSSPLLQRLEALRDGEGDDGWGEWEETSPKLVVSSRNKLGAQATKSRGMELQGQQDSVRESSSPLIRGSGRQFTKELQNQLRVTRPQWYHRCSHPRVVGERGPSLPPWQPLHHPSPEEKHRCAGLDYQHYEVVSQ